MQNQKHYHLRKLAIISMIEECDKRIENEKKFMKRFNSYGLGEGNSRANIARHERIKKYLLERYKN